MKKLESRDDWAQYASQMTMKEPRVLQSLREETQQTIHGAQMLSSPWQGRLLSFLSHLVAPTTILEIGTFTGYSALCLAEGLQENGVLHTIERNKALLPIIQRYSQLAGKEKQIICHIGQAKEIIETLEGPFDIVFIDADKMNYPLYYECTIAHVRKGGLIIADNVMWGGTVLMQDGEDKRTKAMRDFAKRWYEDHRIAQLLLPVRDGILVGRKI